MSVISIDELKKIGQGEEVEIPGFESGTTITVKLKRKSLINLVAQGKIPNELLGVVKEITGDKASSKKQKQDEMDMLDVALRNMEFFETYASEVLVEPTVQDFKDAGLEFTDDQLLAIYSYGQGGIKQHESFRKESDGNKSDK